jgi:hypothetical protein
MSPEGERNHITLDEIISNAKEIMLRNGQHVPTLIVEGSKNLVVGHLNDMPATHGERRELMRFLGQATAKSGRVDQLRQIYMISEGWLSVADDDKPPALIPSQDPQRVEVLIISSIHLEERNKQMKLFEVLRDIDEKVTDLEEFLPEDRKDGSVDVPLLDAFVDGYQMAYLARFN